MTHRKTTQDPPRSHTQLVLLGYLLALMASVCTCSIYASWLAQREAEFAQASDTFGYLQMAQDIRRGSAPHGLPKFTLDSPHARLTLDFLRDHYLPVDNTSLAGPNGYHYVASTNQLICQYPPGVGWMLSLLPEGSAMRAWRLATIGVLAIFAAWACGRAWRTPTPAALLSAGLCCLASVCGILFQGLAISYSIDLLCIPLLFAIMLAFAASRAGVTGVAVAGLSGAAIGWAIVIRIAAALFVPGLLVLAVIAPGRRAGWKVMLGKTAAFIFGLFFTGLLPLMIHQLPLTGSPFRSTYAPTDASPPSIAAIAPNFLYYVAGSGSDFVFRWSAGIAAFAIGLAALGLRGRATRLIGVVLCTLLPTLYFLLHTITTPYYQLPTIFVSLVCFALIFRERAPAAPPAADARAPATPRVLAIAGTALAAFAAVGSAAFLPPLVNSETVAMPDVRLPDGPAHDHPLENPDAWILADRLAGSFWHYHGIVAQSIVPMSPELRAAFLHFIRDRREPLYICIDNPAMYDIGKQMQESGCKFTPIGNFCVTPTDTGKPPPFTTIYRVDFQ